MCWDIDAIVHGMMERSVFNYFFLFSLSSFLLKHTRPIPEAEQSMVWVCGCSLAGIVGSNPAGGMAVCYECCVLSGRVLCVGLITGPEDRAECGVCI
jgi:hypothetical protein